MNLFYYKLCVSNFIDQYILRKKWCRRHGYSCTGKIYISQQIRHSCKGNVFTVNGYYIKCNAKKLKRPLQLGELYD